MAILKIARMGHPVLKAKAEVVADPRAPEIARLAAHMIETMKDADGAGLAAPQVHAPRRVVVFRVPPAGDLPDRYAEAGLNEDTEGVPLTVLVNPEIEILGEETSDAFEGCLSLPGLVGKVPRFTHIRYRGTTPAGDSIEREAEGFHARVVQHECDHLDGILFPQRMVDMSTFGYRDEMRLENEQE